MQKIKFPTHELDNICHFQEASVSDFTKHKIKLIARKKSNLKYKKV